VGTEKRRGRGKKGKRKKEKRPGKSGKKAAETRCKVEGEPKKSGGVAKNKKHGSTARHRPSFHLHLTLVKKRSPNRNGR